MKTLVVLLLLLLSCEKPQHVAKCVTRCEQIKGNCAFSRTTFYQGKRYCYCDCVYGFEENSTEWDNGAK